ncbi:MULTISPECIES: DUF3040 domain-containing protein [Saccharopolyspora]|uniref:DUF3040 domain-containing protein n=3 Tax=Saccharopolyspora TaxID=1835 RepID=A0A4R5BID2_9PSEU|nr:MULTISPECIES: DUF3040 domain-containing protein [Saccharopolyspora]MBQ0924816.1 DUF3040 domain-containing protein [Saccharopolyspora endophytica]TDC94725.1 DUF3040 domain-containing protein [Saccharopolyspora aridisoli]TDD86428.1 DUF3040 domain-containing protein [Saccharopolyspora karakumensis]
MPLSEHEQRQLEQIERALYAEDPKFASTVRGGRLQRPSRRRRLQGIAVFVLGLALLVVGAVIPALRPAEIPVLSVVGFLVMFGGAVIVLSALRGGGDDAEATDNNSGGGDKPKRGSGRASARGSLAQRMEERFRKRFEQ